jgi:hypothetical protein
MVDFNAKVEDNNRDVEKHIDKHGLGGMNQNKEKLIEFCEISNMELSNTFFSHKNIHKSTWNSQDKITKNQIDHFCISKKFGSAVHDARGFRAANIGSDHKL